MYSSIASTLIQYPLFSCFEKEYLSDVLERFSIYPNLCRKSTFLHSEGDPCKFMDVLLTGELEIQKIDENGNLLTIARFFPISSLGENLMFGDSNIYPMNAFCPVDSEILQLDRSFILFLCSENQDFLLALLKDISGKALILTDKIKMISHKSLREKIFEYLARESTAQKSSKVKLRTSKKDLAQLFGVQRTSLSRELAKLRSEGLVEFDAESITLKKLENWT